MPLNEQHNLAATGNLRIFHIEMIYLNREENIIGCYIFLLRNDNASLWNPFILCVGSREGISNAKFKFFQSYVWSLTGFCENQGQKVGQHTYCPSSFP